MKTCSVFLNGASGTTGLNIYNRLSSREDLSLIVLPDDRRKDPACVKDAMDRSDITFLCLPDEASRQAVAMLENPDTVVIDTSTAHRTAPGWTYGFPELTGLREKIRRAKRVANPGCHATGFISLVAPLTENGLVAPDEKLTCFSLTGYSGGGKKMIAEYESEGRDPLLDAPRQYGLSQAHKHLPEMRAMCGLTYDPVFCPVVAPFFEGMEVTVPLFAGQLKGGMEDLKALYRDYYREGMVRYDDADGENGFLSAGALAGYDSLRVSVHGNSDRILLVARFDNLGKGASGAAIQNMNIILGLPEDLGLVRETNG
ncbi:MAG: N-acetyl-gamma-glutamyl-phosphate reductase [Clostridia bacterium]|nr:N-acetyl-gamma-glutamyl-phosphate reductase [Clostridia bacterium]